MQPILIIAAVAVGAALLSTGFLGETITLWVQQLGTGTEDVGTPITDASIDFNIIKMDNGDYFKNVVDACIFHSVNEENGLLAGSTLWCKLSGMDDLKGKIIAEGWLVLEEDYEASTPLLIPIVEFANDSGVVLPVEIGDVTLIAQGPGHLTAEP